MAFWSWACGFFGKCMAIRNFSWVIPGKLAGSAMPGGSMHAVDAYVGADILELHEKGVRGLLTLAPVIEGFGKVCEQTGLSWLYCPIEDFSAPGDPALFARIVDRAVALLRADQPVCVHCRAGIGRTGLGLACILGRYLAIDGAAAMQALTRQRPGLETGRQIEFVNRFLEDGI